MSTIIEKDSPLVPLLVIAFMFFLCLAGAMTLAYVGGVFTGKSDVIANDKRITAQALPTSLPLSTHQSSRP